MLMLLDPLIRKIVFTFAILVGLLLAYGAWSSHMQSIGAAAEKQREEAIAIQHDEKVKADSATIDQSVSQDGTPQQTLEKKWEQP